MQYPNLQILVSNAMVRESFAQGQPAPCPPCEGSLLSSLTGDVPGGSWRTCASWMWNGQSMSWRITKSISQRARRTWIYELWFLWNAVPTNVAITFCMLHSPGGLALSSLQPLEVNTITHFRAGAWSYGGLISVTWAGIVRWTRVSAHLLPYGK